MTIDLFVPRPRIQVPKPPSYVKLDLAFGIGAGTKLFDKSQYHTHGTITGADWATGLHGYALDFTRTVPDYVEGDAVNAQLDVTSGNFSLIARVYLDDVINHQYIYARGLRSTDGFEFTIIAGTKLYLDTNQSGANQTTQSAANTMSISTWTTIGFSRDGAAVTLFKNGVDVTSVKGTHIDPATCSRTYKIGIRDAKDLYPLDGKLEFLRFFGGVALSTSEHLAWHNALA